mmetsp:Transcript_76420/g.224211  ORF Transcript_76420/g.224211 Transcript_76420/m.224211 type:complete len:116 (-) Transcript_76420:127-474(-)
MSEDPAQVAGLQKGARVRLVGLEQRPELNGLEGILIVYSKGEQRWLIRMPDARTQLLRPENLEPLSQQEVCNETADAKAKSLGTKSDRARAALDRLKQRVVGNARQRGVSRSPRR